MLAARTIHVYLVALNLLVYQAVRQTLGMLIVPMSAELGYSISEKGWLLAAPSCGAVFTQLIGGQVTCFLGAKQAVICAFAGLALTALLPLCCSIGLGAALALQVLIGVLYGPMFPANSVLLSRWTSGAEERGFAAAQGELAISLASLGIPYLTGKLEETLGWRCRSILPHMATLDSHTRHLPCFPIYQRICLLREAKSSHTRILPQMPHFHFLIHFHPHDSLQGLSPTHGPLFNTFSTHMILCRACLQLIGIASAAAGVSWALLAANTPSRCWYIGDAEIELLALAPPPTASSAAIKPSSLPPSLPPSLPGSPTAVKSHLGAQSYFGAPVESAMGASRVLAHPAVLALFFVHAAYNLGTLTIYSWSPSYYAEVCVHLEKLPRNECWPPHSARRVRLTARRPPPTPPE